MTPVLHHCHQTRSMRSLWLLYELGLEPEVHVLTFDKALRSEAHLARNPAGRVPALELGDEVVWETGAITEVLCERFPEAGLGRPPGDPERVDWLIWVHFAETISQHAAALTQQHVVLYEDAMRSPTIMKIEAKRLEKTFEAVENRLVASGEYLLSSGFSAADVSVGQAIYMARYFVRLDPLPRLADWYDRISARPAFIRSLPPDGQGIYTQDFYPPWPM